MMKLVVVATNLGSSNPLVTNCGQMVVRAFIEE
jgi:hypothetical protein